MGDKDFCQALTDTGAPCENEVVHGEMYCAQHLQEHERAGKDTYNVLVEYSQGVAFGY